MLINNYSSGIHWVFFGNITKSSGSESGQIQKQPPKKFYKNRCSSSFAKFTGKRLCQNLSFDTEANIFIKKETLAQVSSCGFCKIYKNTFFTEQLLTTAFDRSKRICQKQSRWLLSKYQYESCMIKNITQEAVVLHITFLWHFPGHFLYRTPGSSCSVFL